MSNESSEASSTPLYIIGIVFTFALGYSQVREAYSNFFDPDAFTKIYEYVATGGIVLSVFGPFLALTAMLIRRNALTEILFYAVCGITIWFVFVPNALGFIGGIIAATMFGIIAALVINFTLMARSTILDFGSRYTIILMTALSPTIGAGVAYRSWTHTLPSRMSAWLDVQLKTSSTSEDPKRGKPYCIVMDREITHRSDLNAMATSPTYIVYDANTVYKHTTITSGFKRPLGVGSTNINTQSINDLIRDKKITSGCNPKVDFIRNLPE